jgi:hypothetical protein
MNGLFLKHDTTSKGPRLFAHDACHQQVPGVSFLAQYEGTAPRVRAR